MTEDTRAPDRIDDMRRALSDIPSPLAHKIAARCEVTPNGCWEWQGAKIPEGYGVVSLNGRFSTHRAMYEELVGPIPDGLHIDHLCRNRSCCNPAHLEPVTPRENARRGISPAAENARKTHCSKGHPLEGDNVWHIAGRRKCRTCGMAILAERRAKQKAARIADGTYVPSNAEKTECSHGHPLSGDNLLIRPNGSRRCRACQRASRQRSAAKRKQEGARR